jgi:hypothetical protein
LGQELAQVTHLSFPPLLGRLLPYLQIIDKAGLVNYGSKSFMALSPGEAKTIMKKFRKYAAVPTCEDRLKIRSKLQCSYDPTSSGPNIIKLVLSVIY